MSLLEDTYDDSGYGDEDFKVLLEQSLLQLKEDAVNREIAHTDAYRFEYNFYGLLTYLDIPIRYHWIIMRLNNMMSPMELTRDRRYVTIPELTKVDLLYSYHHTRAKK